MTRKLTALLLILSLLVSTCAPALADALRLPSSLKRIEEGAFAYDTSITEVYIPEGTEYIGSEAFAYMYNQDEPIRVHIPDSVTYIEPDAFEYTYVTFICSMDSYAKSFHDTYYWPFPWEDASPMAQEDAYDLLFDLENHDYSILTTRMEALQTMSTEGVTDPDLLADIEELNQLVAYANEAIDNYNFYAEGLVERAENLAAKQDYELTESDSEYSFSYGGMTISLEKSFTQAMDAGVTVESIDSSDGGDSTLHLSNGTTYYVYRAGNSFRLSQSPKPASLSSLQPRGIAEDIGKLISLLNYIATYVQSVEVMFQDQLYHLNQELGVAENYINQAKHQIERINATYGAPNPGDYSNQSFMIEQIKNKQPDLRRRRNNCCELYGLWAGLNIGINVAVLLQMAIRAQEINEIREHGHPTEEDRADSEIKALARQMSYDITTLITLYIVDAGICIADIVSCVGVVAAAIPTGGAATAAKIAISAIKTYFGLMLNFVEDSLYDSIKNTDRRLHSYVVGMVWDDETYKPLEGVTVAMANKVYTTDEKGEFKARFLDEGKYTFSFRLEDYEPDDITVDLFINTTFRLDRALRKIKGSVYGYVYSDLTGDRIPNVTVSNGNLVRAVSNAEGYYEAAIPLPSETVTFSAPGYKDKQVNLIPNAEVPVQWDVKLTPYPGVELIPENFPDAAFLESLRVWDQDSNGVLDNTELYYINTISVYGDIHSIQGIEYLYNLSTLYIEDGELDAVNISGLERLVDIRIRSFTLEGLSVENCPKLKHVGSNYYNYGYDTPRTALHTFSISNCPEMREINIYNTSLSSCTIFGCDKLRNLYLRNNKLRTLNLGQLNSLFDLDVENNTLTSLSVSHLPSLFRLNVAHNSLTSLSLTGAVANSIASVNCSYNNLVSLDISACTKISGIACQENAFSYVDLRPANHYPLLNWGNVGTQGSKTRVRCYKGVNYDYSLESLDDLFEYEYGLDGYSPAVLEIMDNGGARTDETRIGLAVEDYFKSDEYRDVVAYYEYWSNVDARYDWAMD